MKQAKQLRMMCEKVSNLTSLMDKNEQNYVSRIAYANVIREYAKEMELTTNEIISEARKTLAANQ